MYPFINVFGRTIGMYGVCIVIGVLLANLFAYLVLKKRYSLEYDDVLTVECYGLLGGILGSKLLYLWVSRDQIDWSRMTEWEYLSGMLGGGFVFYGGLILALLFVIVACKAHKVKMGDYFYYVVFAIPFAHAFGRLGCFMAGCCYGRPYDGPFSVVFPSNSFAPSGISLFPIQLVESLCLLLLAGIVFIFCINKTICKWSVSIYLGGYSVIRFILEMYRYDEEERGIYNGLSTSQWISILMFLFSVGFAVYVLISNKKKLKNETE